MPLFRVSVVRRQKNAAGVARIVHCRHSFIREAPETEGNEETPLIAAVDIVGGYMSVCQEITLVPTLLLLKPQSLSGFLF